MSSRAAAVPRPRRKASRLSQRSVLVTAGAPGLLLARTPGWRPGSGKPFPLRCSYHSQPCGISGKLGKALHESHHRPRIPLAVVEEVLTDSFALLARDLVGHEQEPRDLYAG